MKTIVISSSHFANGFKDPGYEVSQLIKASKKYYDNFFLVYPPSVRYHFQPKDKTGKVYLDTEDISEATALIVRNTSACEEATRLLALNLYANKCELLDPLDRFNGTAATKSFMTLKGLKDKTIPPTFIAFSTHSALELLPVIEREDLFPVVGKPTSGKHGKDVQLIKTSQEGKQYIKSFFTKYQENFNGIIFQKYIEIKNEYRVLVLDGKSLGIVEKEATPNIIARNANKGSRFLSVTNEKVEQYAMKYTSNKGLFGTDIALNNKGECFLIESNRSPQWKTFEEATGIDVAEEIMKILEKRIAVSSELF